MDAPFGIIWGVTDRLSWIQESSSRIPPWRWAAGVLMILLVVVLAVLFALGTWNPWRLVILQQRFANPWFGLAVVAAGTYLVLWLLLPVRNEARQSKRIGARAVVAGITVVGLLTWGIVGLLYRYDSTELARSEDGERAVALVIIGGTQARELRIWQGSGLGKRDVGSLGRPCSRVRAHFIDRDTVVVNQGFGDWVFDLDPRTGRPQQVLGPRCPTGPVTVTLGP
jgi:hypothetical protein